MTDYGFHPGEPHEGQPRALPKRTPFATLPDDDLDTPIPYMPVDTAPLPSSSAAGVAALRFSHPAPPISSGGAVTPSSPAPSDDATTHVLDRIPGEPSPLDLDPAYGFTAAVDVDSGITWYERPTVWITPEAYRALGQPQQIEITVRAVRS